MAVVNGTPITRDQLMAESAANVDDQAFLMAVVQKELAAQRAAALGFADDATYAEELRKKQDELAAWKRTQLSALYFRNEVQAKAVVTDDEVRAYFDEHSERIGTELHLLQIFLRDRAQIDEALRAIEGGKPFAEVARQHYPVASPGDTPWDIGFQRYVQMAPSWLKVAYDLKPGRHSAVIEGPNRRYWILELVEQRASAARLDEVQEKLRALLQADKHESLRASAERSLMEGAKIVFTKSAAAPHQR